MFNHEMGPEVLGKGSSKPLEIESKQEKIDPNYDDETGNTPDTENQDSAEDSEQIDSVDENKVEFDRFGGVRRN